MGQVRAALAALCIALPFSAHGQSLCMGYADAVAQLDSAYGERIAVSMLESGGSVLQVFQNDKTGAWTMIQLHPSGVACFVAHGQALQVEPPRGQL